MLSFVCKAGMMDKVDLLLDKVNKGSDIRMDEDWNAV